MMMEIENISSNISHQMDDEETRIENLLSEKLMMGFVLLEKSCPVCATPLVKHHLPHEEAHTIPESDSVKPVLVPVGSFAQPFKHVQGVPFCVACCSHVITQESEITALERCESLKAKGSILSAMQDASYSTESTSQFESQATPEEQSSNIIDVTGVASQSASQQSDSTKSSSEKEGLHSDEKKEDGDHIHYENQNADEIMAEYSVR
jgi:hypothetical protein